MLIIEPLTGSPQSSSFPSVYLRSVFYSAYLPLIVPYLPSLSLLPASRNNLTSDYDLSYGAGLFVSQGDAPTTALVSSSSSSPLFNITNAKGFFRVGNLYITGGMFRNITTVDVPAGGSLYDAVQSMVAAPASFSAQVQSVQAPAGLASGPFIAKVFNSTQHHSGSRGFSGNSLLDMIMRPAV